MACDVVLVWPPIDRQRLYFLTERQRAQLQSTVDRLPGSSRTRSIPRHAASALAAAAVAAVLLLLCKCCLLILFCCLPRCTPPLSLR